MATAAKPAISPAVDSCPCVFTRARLAWMRAGHAPELAHAFANDNSERKELTPPAGRPITPATEFLPAHRCGNRY
jgi:hypothetical protein